MRVLVTGANGFVGRAVCVRLSAQGHDVVKGVRIAHEPDETSIGDIDNATAWDAVLKNCDAVVHLAARVHVMNETAVDPLIEFRRVNTAGTLNLARQAAAVGIKRFIYMSSIKVNGEAGIFSGAMLAQPQDAYAQSKWEAETGLQAVAATTGLELVILRPPLVYGPGVSANFLRLLQSVNRRTPLPFGLIRNRRSLIYIGNLADAVSVSVTHPHAAGRTYLVSDGEDVSTPELIRLMAECLGRPARLLPVPPSWLRFAGGLIGKTAEVDRLLGSLALDSAPIREELGWLPPSSLYEGLQATADWYLKTNTR